MLVEVLEGRWTEVEVEADEGPGGGLGRRVVVAEEAMLLPAGRSWSAKVWTELRLRVRDDERVGASRSGGLSRCRRDNLGRRRCIC
jgi:hypothetical protein